MPLFDSYLMVDWSASSSPKTGPDSIWWAMVDRNGASPPPSNPSTRARARQEIVALIADRVAAGRRVLAGFDFPFGFPRGAAAQIGGSPTWRALWTHLAETIADDAKNRFQAASAMNEMFDGPGPFWGHPHQHQGAYAALSPTKPARLPSHPPLRRHAEEAISAAKTVWQLWGAGSVGGQALLGIPFLQALLNDPALRDHIAVWPFQTGLAAPRVKSVVVAEIYPSLLKIRRADGEPLDKTQVATLARYFAHWDERGDFQSAFELPEVTDSDVRSAIVEEEGYILGLGCARPPQ